MDLQPLKRRTTKPSKSSSIKSKSSGSGFSSNAWKPKAPVPPKQRRKHQDAAPAFQWAAKYNQVTKEVFVPGKGMVWVKEKREPWIHYAGSATGVTYEGPVSYDDYLNGNFDRRLYYDPNDPCDADGKWDPIVYHNRVVTANDRANAQLHPKVNESDANAQQRAPQPPQDSFT